MGISSPGQPVRVAAPVPALVGRADDRADWAQGRCGVEDALAENGVLVHELPLDPVERGGLVEDLVRNPDLADVVQLCRPHEHVELLGIEAEAAPDPLREVGHVGRVIV